MGGWVSEPKRSDTTRGPRTGRPDPTGAVDSSKYTALRDASGQSIEHSGQQKVQTTLLNRRSHFHDSRLKQRYLRMVLPKSHMKQQSCICELVGSGSFAASF